MSPAVDWGRRQSVGQSEGLPLGVFQNKMTLYSYLPGSLVLPPLLITIFQCQSFFNAEVFCGVLALLFLLQKN